MAYVKVVLATQLTAYHLKMKNLTAAQIDTAAAVAGATAADAIYEYYGENYFVSESLVSRKVAEAYDAAYKAKKNELTA